MLGESGGGNFERFCKADNTWHVQGPRTIPLFVATAVNLSRKSLPDTGNIDIKRSNALRTVHLVRRERCQIDAQFPNIKGNFSYGLGRIRMKNDLPLFLSCAVSWLEASEAILGYAEKPAGMSPPLNYNPVTGKIDGLFRAPLSQKSPIFCKKALRQNSWFLTVRGERRDY
jgi:hypothetical protein